MCLSSAACPLGHQRLREASPACSESGRPFRGSLLRPWWHTSPELIFCHQCLPGAVHLTLSLLPGSSSSKTKAVHVTGLCKDISWPPLWEEVQAPLLGVQGLWSQLLPPFTLLHPHPPPPPPAKDVSLSACRALRGGEQVLLRQAPLLTDSRPLHLAQMLCGWCGLHNVCWFLIQKLSVFGEEPRVIWMLRPKVGKFSKGS